jgi:hypothetical protein
MRKRKGCCLRQLTLGLYEAIPGDQAIKKSDSSESLFVFFSNPEFAIRNSLPLLLAELLFAVAAVITHQ